MSKEERQRFEHYASGHGYSTQRMTNPSSDTEYANRLTSTLYEGWRAKRQQIIADALSDVAQPLTEESALNHELVGCMIAEIALFDDQFGHTSFPRFELAPDVTKFSKQRSDINCAEYEWVYQAGDGDYGCHGTMAFHIGGDVYMMFDFSE